MGKHDRFKAIKTSVWKKNSIYCIWFWRGIFSIPGTKPRPRSWVGWNFEALEPRDLRKGEKLQEDAAKGIIDSSLVFSCIVPFPFLIFYVLSYVFIFFLHDFFLVWKCAQYSQEDFLIHLYKCERFPSLIVSLLHVKNIELCILYLRVCFVVWIRLYRLCRCIFLVLFLRKTYQFIKSLLPSSLSGLFYSGKFYVYLPSPTSLFLFYM